MKVIIAGIVTAIVIAVAGAYALQTVQRTVAQTYTAPSARI